MTVPSTFFKPYLILNANKLVGLKHEKPNWFGQNLFHSRWYQAVLKIIRAAKDNKHALHDSGTKPSKIDKRLQSARCNKRFKTLLEQVTCQSTMWKKWVLGQKQNLYWSGEIWEAGQLLRLYSFSPFLAAWILCKIGNLAGKRSEYQNGRKVDGGVCPSLPTRFPFCYEFWD